MNTPALLCGGKPLSLGRKIGRGGEGEVYAVSDGTGRAVKIFFNPDAAREAKVTAMAATSLGSHSANVAFPHEVVRRGDGTFAGFTMAEVSGYQPIHELMSPGSRRKYFPAADWRFLARAASNVARIVASIHKTGVVIGDINSAGFLVSQQATVALIDADSFQFGGHRCRVGKAEYTAGELQGARFSEVDRTPDHDAFGLAVILFQILFQGRHPFAGVPGGRPITTETAIRQGRFAYTLIRNAGTLPPPGTLRLKDLPRGVRLLFERAFALRVGPRPTATEWVRELSYLEDALSECPVNAQHIMASSIRPCPWCRIEREVGHSTFGAARRSQPVRHEIASSDFAQKTRAALENARREAGETLQPLWPRPAPGPSQAAQTVSPTQAHSNLAALAKVKLILPKATAARFIKRHDEASAKALRALAKWRKRIGIWELHTRTVSVSVSLSEIEHLQARACALVEQSHARAIANKAAALMSIKHIADAQIVGIGATLREHLVKHGIVSAAHIKRSALAAISGLGEARVVALLLWRDTIAVAAERSATSSCAPSNAAISAELERIEKHIARFERAISTDLAAVQVEVVQIREHACLLDRDTDEALRALDQTTADLKHLVIDPIAQRATRPSITLPAPAAVAPKRKQKAATKKPTKGCPRCGSSMVQRWKHGPPGTNGLFLGCVAYPQCLGTRPVRQKRKTP